MLLTASALLSPRKPIPRAISDDKKPGMALDMFQDSLARFTKYSRFNIMSTLKYGNMFNNTSIVSSIEFDRDEEFFATAGKQPTTLRGEGLCLLRFFYPAHPFYSFPTSRAGVSKKIKVYEYKSIMSMPKLDMHNPIVTMPCRAKIRCVFSSATAAGKVDPARALCIMVLRPLFPF